ALLGRELRAREGVARRAHGVQPEHTSYGFQDGGQKAEDSHCVPFALRAPRSTPPHHSCDAQRHGSRPCGISSTAPHLMQRRTNTCSTPLSTTRLSLVQPPHSCAHSCGVWVIRRQSRSTCTATRTART